MLTSGHTHHLTPSCVLSSALALAASFQVDKLLKQLQQERQQHQQQQFVVLLHPAAAAAVEGSSSVPVTRSADNEHAVSNKLQQLQEQLSELAAAYEVQLHVLPPQPQRDAHDSATLTLSGGAAEQHQAAGGNHADQPSSSNIGSSSSSSGSVGSLLLSGLGQAGRVAAGAATAAASAVLYAIEGAAAATTAAIVAYEQRGVDVAADLPDTSLRPRWVVCSLKIPTASAHAYCMPLVPLFSGLRAVVGCERGGHVTVLSYVCDGEVG